MLCKVHPEHYIPPLTQPIKNAPDLYHFKGLGMLFCLEAEESRMLVCGLVGWSDLIWWSGLAVVVCSDGLIWWSGPTMVWCGIRMRWPDLWSDCLYGGLMDWFHGLIWGTEEDGVVWRLEIEKITSWVYSSEMTQLNVRELRKQKQRKKGNTCNFFSVQLKAWKAVGFKLKRVCKNPTKHFQGLVTLAATLLIPMSNILVTIQTLAVAICSYIIWGCGSDDDLCQTFPFLEYH